MGETDDTSDVDFNFDSDSDCSDGIEVKWIMGRKMEGACFSLSKIYFFFFLVLITRKLNQTRNLSHLENNQKIAFLILFPSEKEKEITPHFSLLVEKPQREIVFPSNKKLTLLYGESSLRQMICMVLILIWPW